MGSVCNNAEEPIPPLCNSDMEVATLRVAIELKALPVVMMSGGPRFMAVCPIVYYIVLNRIFTGIYIVTWTCVTEKPTCSRLVKYIFITDLELEIDFYTKNKI
jgi:hypothetical protein